MIGIKTDLKNAQTVKLLLLKKKILSTDCIPYKDNDFIIFPVIKKQKLKDTTILEDFSFEESVRKIPDFKDNIKNQLSENELKTLKTAYDTVGDIAILEIDDDLRNKEIAIANALLFANKQIKVVVRKDSSHEGVFRTQKMKILAGEKRLETIHKENKIRLKLNVETVYFSPRLSTERKRINELVKSNEDVLVMFSGCGVYPINIAKNTKAKHIVGVEINPEGHKYAMQNIILNKVKNVDLYLGDVNDIVPTLNKKFDRILMPLPKSAEDFLDLALSVSKKGTTIHLYDFLHEDKFELAKEKIAAACKRNNMEFKILDLVKCGQHAPRVYRICVDFKIL